MNHRSAGSSSGKLVFGVLHTVTQIAELLSLISDPEMEEPRERSTEGRAEPIGKHKR